MELLENVHLTSLGMFSPAFLSLSVLIYRTELWGKLTDPVLSNGPSSSTCHAEEQTRNENTKRRQLYKQTYIRRELSMNNISMKSEIHLGGHGVEGAEINSK